MLFFSIILLNYSILLFNSALVYSMTFFSIILFYSVNLIHYSVVQYCSTIALLYSILHEVLVCCSSVELEFIAYERLSNRIVKMLRCKTRPGTKSGFLSYSVRCLRLVFCAPCPIRTQHFHTHVTRLLLDGTFCLVFLNLKQQLKLQNIRTQKILLLLSF